MGASEQVLTAIASSEASARSDVAMTETALERLLLEHFSSHVEDGRKLAMILDVPASGIGLLCAVKELLIDLQCVRKATSVPEWFTEFEQMLSCIIRSAGEHVIERDRLDLRAQKISPLRQVLTAASGQDPNQQTVVRALRGLLVTKLLSSHVRLTASISSQFACVRKNAKSWANRPEDINAVNLRNRQQMLAPESSELRVIPLLIEALAPSLRDPFPPLEPSPRSTAKAIAVAAPVLVSRSDQQNAEDDDAQSPPDLLRRFAAEIGTSGCKVFSGIELYDHLASFEIEAIVPRLIARRSSGQSTEVIVAFMALFTRVVPSAYHLLPIVRHSGRNVELDLEAGHLCWNIAAVTEGNLSTTCDRFVRIPLPTELLSGLRQLYTMRPNVRTVADLFPDDLDQLARRTKSMLRELSVTSHRPTLTRLANSWGRYVLVDCHDEAYSAAIGLAFTLGTTANFNYLRIRGRSLVRIVRRAYLRAGLSGDCGLEPESVGSLYTPARETAEAFLRQMFDETARAIEQVPRRCTFARLVQSHNTIVTCLYAAFKLLLSGRTLSEETTTAVCIDAATGLVVLSDKRTAPYHERRVVCMPRHLRLWMRAYMAWLQSLSYRLSTWDRSLAGRIAATTDRRGAADLHPFFFSIGADGTTSPLGSGDITHVMKKFEMAPHAGRHFLDELFREAELDSAVIMGWMGRGMAGQEAFSRNSAAIPLDTLQQGTRVLDAWMETLDLAAPPALMPRTVTPAVYAGDRKDQYVAKLLRSRPLSVRQNRDSEPCPFFQATPMRASLYERVVETWRHHGPPEDMAGVALSLIIEDGLQHFEELQSTMAALREGAAYRHGEDVFVDSQPASLGIRRVWLSATTTRLVLLAAPTVAALPTREELNSAAAALLSRAGCKAADEPISHLILIAQAWRALRLPSLVSGWMDGKTFARTSRPQTVARELIGTCEPPQLDFSQEIRQRQSRSSVMEILLDCAKGVPLEVSHQTAISKLEASLSDTESDHGPESLEGVTTGYCKYLCSHQKNIHTIQRYLSACAPFIDQAITLLQDIAPSALDWTALAQEFAGASDDPLSEPVSVSINHFLRWQGINAMVGKREGPPPSALQYSDRLTARESERAVSLLLARRKMIGDDWHRAAVALQLLVCVPMRWDEVAKLRLCDLAIDETTPHIVIAAEAGAALKSRNAQRILVLRSQKALESLRTLKAVRAARFPNNAQLSIFGDRNEVDEDSTNRIRELIGQAIRYASGSSALRPHSARHTVLTQQVTDVLDSRNVKLKKPLELRQSIFQISASAGHGHPEITLGHYVSDLDRCRRTWMDFLLLEAPKPSHEFISRITGLPAATIRQRIHRRATPSAPVIPAIEKVQFDTAPSNFIDLASLVTPDLAEIPWEASSGQQAILELTRATVYVGLRLSGDDEKIAARSAQLFDKEAQAIEARLRNHREGRHRHFELCEIKRKRFIDDALAGRLASGIAALEPAPGFIRNICAALRTLDDPIPFHHRTEMAELAKLLPAFHEAGMRLQVCIRESSSSRADDRFIGELTTLGFPRPLLMNSRGVPSGAECGVRILRINGSDGSGGLRASRHLAFHASISLLALLLSLEHSK